MKLGLQIPSFSWPGGAERMGPTLASIARAAEDAGFSSLWAMGLLPQSERSRHPTLHCEYAGRLRPHAHRANGERSHSGSGCLVM